MKACWRVNHPTLHTLRFVISCETFTLVTRKRTYFLFEVEKYFQFAVGAALLCADGTTILGD